MYYVYILKSLKQTGQIYIGFTQDLEKRIKEHNSNKVIFSKRYSPWEIETYIALKNKKLAADLERYLKSGSGFAFLKKRLLHPLQ